MLITVQEPNEAHRELIKNMILFFRYDLMPFIEEGCGSNINPYGVIDSGEYWTEKKEARTHQESLESWNEFWEMPEKIFPMLIEVDEKPAGFAMVVTRPYCHPTVDYRLNDFYVLNTYRGHGVAREAAFRIFDRFPGVWEIGWLEKNKPAEACWRSVAAEYTGGVFEDWGMISGDTYPGVKFTSPGARRPR